MRLIENLVSDLIRQSTGINPRRVVRRIGGGRLLMAGGLAAAGALLADKVGGGSGPGTTSGSGGGYAYTKPPAHGAGGPSAAPPPTPPPGSVPPPPGSPREVAPPPPPPQPGPTGQAESAETAGAADLTFAAARTAVAAAMADGRLDAAEREAVQRHVADSDLTSEQAARVHGDLLEPATPEELAALATEPEDRRALYELAALVLRADREVSDAERRWLDALAAALGLDAGTRGELEAEVFAGDGGDSDREVAP